MASLWKFGGLTPLKLIKQGAKKLGEDELSTRSGALSYYFLLALFPMCLFLVSLVGVFAGPGTELRNHILTAMGRLAPGTASALMHKVVDETFRHSSGLKLVTGLIGALWAASGGMGAIATSLNVINGIEEKRSFVRRKLTILGLTLGLGLLMLCGLVLVLYGGTIGHAIANHVGLGGVFTVVWNIVQWPVALFALFLSFSLVYYFAPDLEQRKWFWVTPGAVAGVVLWLAASFGLRVYLHFFNSYSATYGSLGAVIILMLWLYITGFAILVGGEVNWVIDNEDRHAATVERKKRELEQRLKAADRAA